MDKSKLKGPIISFLPATLIHPAKQGILESSISA